MERREFLQRSIACAALTTTAGSVLHAKQFSYFEGNAQGKLQENLYHTTTAHFTSRGKPVKVHAISTGAISVKKNFMVKHGRGFISKLNVNFGKEYTPYLPIWVYVIEHPEGIIIIDTGDIEAASHEEFYENESVGNKMILKAMSNRRIITRDDELDVQLAKLNIKTTDISKIVLTHLHGDHMDGIRFFATTEIVVNEMEHKHPVGYLPTTAPDWFDPTLVNYQKNRVDYFDNGYSLTQAEDLFLIPTPGHTHHHSSVLFRTDQEHILFAGDLTYQRYQLEKHELSGSHIDYALALASIQKTLDYASRYPLIYLSAHDMKANNFLREKITC